MATIMLIALVWVVAIIGMFIRHKIESKSTFRIYVVYVIMVCTICTALVIFFECQG